MRRASTTFQPYDRATGTELSQKQQEDCQVYYLIIKAYIDGVERRTEAPPQWTRKKLRYSTAELLQSIAQLARDIRQTFRAEFGLKDGTSDILKWAEVDRDIIAVSNSGVSSAAAVRYQEAVNLLHELVSRLVDRDVASTYRLLPDAQESLSPRHWAFALSGSSLSSTSSITAVSGISGAVISSARTESSKASNEQSQTLLGPRVDSDEIEEATFEIDPLDELPHEGSSHCKEEKEKVTFDWVLEYLRGGWQFHGQASGAEPTMSPVPPLSNDTSPIGSFRQLQRTASDNISLHSEDGVAHVLRCSSARAGKCARPIPTMASRLRSKVAHEGSHDADARFSNTSGLEYFKTPRSIISGGTTFCTPEDGRGHPLSAVHTSQTSAWNKYLRQKGLIPNPFEEMDWSGRGQHAEFDATEEAEVPLKLEKALGYSANALVESVRCKRIRLARKTVQVSRRLRKEEAMKEVEHLQRLKHPHIIRVIGTYTMPRTLSILLYPVADYTLDAFLESTQDGLPAEECAARLYSISTFLRCLAKAVQYIHEQAMKHMDIKPKILLVRDMRESTICNQGMYKIYVADFGIARSYLSVDECNTESPTAYTRTYAAPEVIAQERRDQKADIFSLGAVYTEMLAVLSDRQEPDRSNLDILHDLRESNNTDRSYAGCAPSIQDWLRYRLALNTYGFESDTDHSPITELVAFMLSVDPAERPDARTVRSNIPFIAFCCDVNGGSEPFEAANRPKDRQLYDRAMEIAEADERYWRCPVEGCVKVYSSRGKLAYHKMRGHGQYVQDVAEATESGLLNAVQEVPSSHAELDAWSTF